MTSPLIRLGIFGINYAPEPTGIAPYTSDLAAGLAARGHEVSVLTGYPHYPAWDLDPRYGGHSLVEKIDDVRVTRLRHYVPTTSGVRERTKLELSFGAKLIRAHWPEIDVLLCVSPALISSSMALAKARNTRRKLPVGIWVQDLYGSGAAETGLLDSRGAALTTEFESRVYRSADSVIAVHERFRNQIVNTHGVAPDRVSVIRNWTHLHKQPAADPAATRAAMGWSPDDVIVLHAGNMGVKQGLENVVRAAGLMAHSHPSVRIVMLGDGNQRAKLERMAAHTTSIEFLRPLPENEYVNALAAADILLVNEKQGLSEMAIPSKLTSYFSSGRPVLAATQAGSVTEQELTLSGAGLCVPPGQPEALIRGIVELSSDHTRGSRMGAHGLAFLDEYLTRSSAIDKFEQWALTAAARGRT